MTRHVKHLVSVSGGKDSTATLLLALAQFPKTTSGVFADTGNEHEATYEYLEYLQARLGIKIHHLKADFSDRFASKRKWITEKWPLKGVSPERVARALELFQPTGNPFLDLCMLKGRFPSRMAQFCTTELKTLPLMEHALDIVEIADCDVWSWQGVRRDESLNRRNALGFEDLTGGIFAFRPIVGWSAQMTVDFVTKLHGIRLNPLYEQGMGRVGCMPCINASKAELAEIARRFPEHIARIAAWEKLVAEVCFRGGASFFVDRDDERAVKGGSVYARIEWAKTLRGGKILNPIYDEPAPVCASSYGLCE